MSAAARSVPPQDQRPRLTLRVVHITADGHRTYGRTKAFYAKGLGEPLAVAAWPPCKCPQAPRCRERERAR